MKPPPSYLYRIILIAAVTLAALAACTEAPESSSGNASDTIAAADQKSGKQEIAVDTIARDLVGRVIPITELTGSHTPTDWTFEASEFKQVEIVDKQATENAATIVIFMTTRNNAGPNDDAVQVSGKLQLYYERRGGKWLLVNIVNLTFRYTVGLAT